MNQRTFIDELKYRYKFGGMAIRLIFVNVAIFLAIQILLVFGRLSGSPEITGLIASKIFVLPTDIDILITQPWTMFTYMFAQYNIWHLLFNMLMLFYFGSLFLSFLDSKRLLYTYFIAGVFGALTEILAHAVIPEVKGSGVVGASGAIMGILAAVAYHRPNQIIHLFGIFQIRLIFLALFLFLMDFIALGTGDGTAHFAHIGGALAGFLASYKIHSKNNMVNFLQRIGSSILSMFSRKPKLKVKKGGANPRMKTDEEYAEEKKLKQEQIDLILDKISKSGYESLTKKEKDFLFNQSKNG